jgi:hypothetical protein
LNFDLAIDHLSGTPNFIENTATVSLTQADGELIWFGRSAPKLGVLSTKREGHPLPSGKTPFLCLKSGS